MPASEVRTNMAFQIGDVVVDVVWVVPVGPGVRAFCA
jgi:hypothetical protein